MDNISSPFITIGLYKRGFEDELMHNALLVHDDKLVFDSSELAPLDTANMGDRVWLAFDDKRGGQQRLFFSGTGTGRMRARRIETREYGREQAVEESRISAVMQRTRDGYVLEAEMPGVSKDGLEVLLEGNELTIVGRRTSEAPQAHLIYRESADRDYRRSFELDPAIDTGRITARMDEGILYLELPKSERVKPRKITVE